MTFGPFLFLQPLALLGLLSLPILWFLLRATPPEPKRALLPSLPLFRDLRAEEETPSRTPWWLLALRLLALALAIIGFAKPTWAPNAALEATGRALVVVDDGWTSAQEWREVTRHAISAIEEATEGNTPVHVMFTAPRTFPRDFTEPLDVETARQVIRNARPASWLPDRNDAIERLAASDLSPQRVIWISDGFDHDTGRSFADQLSNVAPTEIRIARPGGGFAITSADSSAQGARVSVVRALDGVIETADVIAETAEGASISSTQLEFAADQTTAEALFEIPTAALNRVARFRIAGVQSAGAVWMWDDAARRPHVGLADAGSEAQPLLSEHYYVRKALEPYAQLTEQPLDQLIEADVDAIVLGDRGAISDDDETALRTYIDEGGVLIRFAGPRLAAQADELIPTPLRPTSRALGGSLAWETPQRLSDFTSTSPFFGIPLPKDTVVRQQVLAQPSADLPTHTWARLEDGTPLVTGAAVGRGQLVLFHVTADPDWSDLPYTGAFVEMLRRSVVSGGDRSNVRSEAEGTLTPVRTLDGFGLLGTPSPGATPIQAEAFVTTRPGPASPPGLYSGPGGERALNAGAPAPLAFTQWPASVSVTEEAAVLDRRGLGGWMIAAAMAIVALDLLIALAFAGRLPQWGRGAATAFIAGLVFVGAPSPAEAQSSDDKAMEAALGVRFAYVRTGDGRLDQITEAGLFGLSFQLGQRTSVEPDMPHAVDLERDHLEVYPLIYYAVPRDAQPLTPAAAEKVNAYLRAGGAFVVDTRDAAPGSDVSADLETLLAGIDAPPLQPAPSDHVITKSYYLLRSFPGRLNGRLWVERGTGDRDTRRGDGVSALFIGGSDWAGAWAIDRTNGQPLLTMQGGEAAREMAYRFGINLVMYVLTGNYKEDQVHVPDLLERLGREDQSSRSTD